MAFNQYISNFESVIQPAMQTGYIDHLFQQPLDSKLAYREMAEPIGVPGSIGQTLSFDIYGRFTPNELPSNPSLIGSDLNNGAVSTEGNVEQYMCTLNDYKGMTNIDLKGMHTLVANQLKQKVYNLGIMAAQSIERVCRNKLFDAYMGGNTRVRGDLGASTTTTCHVDDIRGFQNNWVNGQLQAVSASNPITVYETKVLSGGVTQTLTVIGVTADNPNNTSFPSASNNGGGSAACSGVLTFNAVATPPVSGDALVAANAPMIIRCGAKQTTAQLASGDVPSWSAIQSAITYLNMQGVARGKNGKFNVIMDPSVPNYLTLDQLMMTAYQGTGDSSSLYSNDEIKEFLGCRFRSTTEAYIQKAGSAPDVNVNVGRMIVLAAEAIFEADWQPLDDYQNSGPTPSIGIQGMVNGTSIMIRPPVDNELRICTATYSYVGDFVPRTDSTTTPLIVPTCSNADYKRAVVIEYALD